MNLQATIKFVIVSVRLILRKVVVARFTGHHGKATSDRKMIFISPQRNKGGNGDYCSHFSVTLETPSKSFNCFCKIGIGKSRG